MCAGRSSYWPDEFKCCVTEHGTCKIGDTCCGLNVCRKDGDGHPKCLEPCTATGTCSSDNNCCDDTTCIDGHCKPCADVGNECETTEHDRTTEPHEMNNCCPNCDLDCQLR